MRAKCYRNRNGGSGSGRRHQKLLVAASMLLAIVICCLLPTVSSVSGGIGSGKKSLLPVAPAAAFGSPSSLATEVHVHEEGERELPHSSSTAATTTSTTADPLTRRARTRVLKGPKKNSISKKKSKSKSKTSSKSKRKSLSKKSKSRKSGGRTATTLRPSTATSQKEKSSHPLVFLLAATLLGACLAVYYRRYHRTGTSSIRTQDMITGTEKTRLLLTS
eukprot:CAMPEP_0168185274 /NCGR_PEP_ID=MMETSP0139_2-20121125/13746_1 /TAXON_ID=44445 /ORGANISM="Pseudo-nitzschia australis, Strain 10249 10 AB" /LENGTH=218 /DNA_ID=CAMNT_0008107073 /DNA_START=116 /DNA_END=772 /DNA_ORIENTATION=+